MFEVIKSNRLGIKISLIFIRTVKSRKMSSDPRIIAIFWEIVIVEFNSEVRILTGSWEIGLSAHAQLNVAEILAISHQSPK